MKRYLIPAAIVAAILTSCGGPAIAASDDSTAGVAHGLEVVGDLVAAAAIAGVANGLALAQP
jgi:hypothetical protein